MAGSSNNSAAGSPRAADMAYSNGAADLYGKRCLFHFFYFFLIFSVATGLLRAATKSGSSFCLQEKRGNVCFTTGTKKVKVFTSLHL